MLATGFTAPTICLRNRRFWTPTVVRPLFTRGCNAPQGTRAHLPIHERAGRCYPLADVIRQLHCVRRTHEADTRRTLLEKSGFPAPRFRCLRHPRRVFQPERHAISLE